MQVQSCAAAAGVPVLAAGFSPAAALAALADHLGWRAPFLADPDRLLYARLGLHRAPLWRVYSTGTVLRYVRAAARGVRLPRPVEDIRQLGGDAVIRDGLVVRRWLPRTPNDRVRPAMMVAAAAS